jgi:hypothetical protein
LPTWWANACAGSCTPAPAAPATAAENIAEISPDGQLIAECFISTYYKELVSLEILFDIKQIKPLSDSEVKNTSGGYKIFPFVLF